MAFITNPGSNVLTERMRIKSNGNVGIGTDDPKANLHVHGDAVISGGLNSGSGFVSRSLSFANISHGINIVLSDLYNLDGNAHREAMVTITFNGMKGDMSSRTAYRKVIRLTGLTQWGVHAMVDVTGYGGSGASITSTSNSSNGLTLHVPVPNGTHGAFFIEVMGTPGSNLPSISYTVPSSQVATEDHQQIAEEASSVPTESNELQELKKLVTDLGAEVNSLKNQLKGIE
jgi:hypothetical protein